jgi:hypothetical protein
VPDMQMCSPASITACRYAPLRLIFTDTSSTMFDALSVKVTSTDRKTNNCLSYVQEVEQDGTKSNLPY